MERRLSLLPYFLAVPLVAQGQPFSPHIGYVYPAGGRQGATFQAVVGGQSLGGVSNIYVSGAGIQAEVIGYTRPLTPRELNVLREQMRELQEKRQVAAQSRRTAEPATTNIVWTATDEKMLLEIRQKLFANDPKRLSNPAIAETVTLRVTMPADAEPGQRELRLGTPAGLSNPLVFCVGQLPEFSKKPASLRQEPNPGKAPRFSREPDGAAAPSETNITLPAVINGQILPGGVDRFRFRAHQGEKLVIAASARELLPYLADAVPGWFQATLALYDGKGHELAYNDHFRFHPDPVLYYEIPKDGDYALEIKDSLYRGREDFVYRITAGPLPFVTSIFPLGGRTGTQTSVELTGWNLPVTKVPMDAQDKEPGIYPVSVRKEERVSNSMPFAVDTLPESLEQEPNDQPERAQLVTLPLLVNGRIDPPGDWDVFRFEGRAGEEVVAEVYARRLNSPLDSVLKLTDATGRQLAFNDDHEDKGAGLITHQADSYLAATLPSNGTYYVHLGDAQHQGGAEYAYRLRISPPRPDFELRVAPSSITVRGGASVPLTVYALRKDGFSNEIALVIKDAPAGFTLSGGRLPANQDQVRLTLTAAPTAEKEPVSLHLEGRAMVRDHEVSRPAVPAEDMMQAFIYRHLVPVKELKVALAGRAMPRGPVKILSKTPITIPAGGTAWVQVGVPATTPAGRLQLELSDPPDGIAIQSVSPSGGGAEIVLHCDAAKVKPGLKGNLIIFAFGARPQAAGKAKAQANTQRASLGALPAIPFEIVTP